MIDLHSHLLPGVDDGSRSVGQSVAVLTRLLELGVHGVCLTPHLLASEASSGIPPEHDRAFEALRPAIPEGVTIYRGDAYGPEFLNNSFTGDAGGQLVHRKVIRTARDGVNLEGERPADERGVEFAASADTWVRVVNFANAPDGCLYICDMYREIIEHPWSIPEEIKQYLDLNNGNDRGRVWRIIPERGAPRKGQRVAIDGLDTKGLVALRRKRDQSGEPYITIEQMWKELERE